MALGYEGLIKVGAYYALGTGSSVPRSRIRLESSAGYGGQITDSPDPDKIGIGLPYNYDWSQYDGSLNLELTATFFRQIIKDWIISNRQTAKTVTIQPRNGASQIFSTAYWNSINLTASDGSAAESSIAFVALVRDSYAWGYNYEDKTKKQGNTKFCPLDIGMPPPLNYNSLNRNPVPFWNTKLLVGAATPTLKNFITWSLDFSQEVVKFFGCTQVAGGVDPGAKEPLYLAVGPMTVTLSGSYMEDFNNTPNAFLGDTIDQVQLFIANESIKLKRLEVNTESDDIQTGGALVPLAVEYAVYEIAA